MQKKKTSKNARAHTYTQNPNYASSSSGRFLLIFVCGCVSVLRWCSVPKDIWEFSNMGSKFCDPKKIASRPVHNLGLGLGTQFLQFGGCPKGCPKSFASDKRDGTHWNGMTKNWMSKASQTLFEISSPLFDPKRAYAKGFGAPIRNFLFLLCHKRPKISSKFAKKHTCTAICYRKEVVHAATQ